MATAAASVARDLAKSSSAARSGCFVMGVRFSISSIDQIFTKKKYASNPRRSKKAIGGTRSKSNELSAFQVRELLDLAQSLDGDHQTPDRHYELGDSGRGDEHGMRNDVQLARTNRSLPRNAIWMIQSGIVASNGTSDQASAERTSCRTGSDRPSRRQLTSTSHAPAYKQDQSERRTRAGRRSAR